MKRRDFLKLVTASIATSVFPYITDAPEEWTLSIDDDLLHEAITIESTSDNGKPSVTVVVNVEKMWSSATVTNTRGLTFHTTDGETWHDENGVTLDANTT